MLLLGLAAAGQPTETNATGPDLGPDTLTLTFAAPAYTIKPDDQGNSRIIMQGFGDDLTPGHYLLPVQAHNVALPPDAVLSSVEVTAVEVETTTLPGPYHVAVAQEASLSCGTAAGVPRRAAVCGPAAVGHASAAGYRLWNITGQPATPASAAAQQLTSVSLSRVGQMRKWLIADVTYAPFRYDAATGALTVAQKVVVTVHYRRDASRLDPALLQDRVMDAEANERLTNAEQAQTWYAAAASATAASAPADKKYDYVIITTQDIVDHSSHLSALEYAKELRGHNVWIVTETTYDSYIGPAPETRADGIRKFLQAQYAARGIRYVLLIGDPDPVDPNDTADFVGDVPMKMTYPRLHATEYPEWPNAPTDYYYSDLTGNWDLNGDGLSAVWPEDVGTGGVDYYFDVYVGRIPSYQPHDYAELDRILRRTTAYMDASFWTGDYRHTSALLPMSFAAAGYDGARLAEELEPILSQHGYTNIWTMYQQANGKCANSAYASSEELDADTNPVVANRWAGQPFGLVLWWAHGSATGATIGYHDDNVAGDCWDGPLFTSGDAPRLNGEQPAFVFLNACLNGTPEVVNNLGYSLLANGAVATVSASRVSWFSRDQAGNFHSGNTNASLAMRYAENVASGLSTAGEALSMARAVGSSTIADWHANYLVFNLYGDPDLAMTNDPYDAVPGIPVNFTIEQTDIANYFRARWADTAINESGFRLEKRREDWGDWSAVTIVGADVLSAIFLNDDCGRNWYYRAVAFNDAGEKASFEALLTRPVCAPYPPMNANIALQQGGIEVTWELFDSTYGPTQGFRVYRRPFTGGSWQQVSGNIPVATRSFLDSALECDTTYEYFVKAYNAAGESDASNWVHTWSGYCPPDAPTNVHQTGSTQSSISFAWQDNSTSEVLFQIERVPVASGGTATSLPAAPGNATSYTDADPPLSCGATRYYRVGARNKFETGWSGWVRMTTASCTQPTGPSALTANTTNAADPTHIYLAWTDNSSNETGFRIERSVNGASFAQIGVTDANQTTFRDPFPCATAPRSYRVQAYNDVGGSLFANIANATLTDCNPYAPVLSASRVGPSQVDLSWTNQSAPGATTDYFQVLYSRPPFQYDHWYLLTDHLAPNVRSYSHTTPICDIAAFYFVVAVDGTTRYPSDVVSVAIPPCAPHELEASVIGQTSLQIQWKDRSDIEDGVKVYGEILPLHQWIQIADVPANVEQAHIGGLQCGFEHRLSVRAYADEGAERIYSALADTLVVTTLPCTPAAPTHVSITGATASSISLQWASASTPVDGFRIMRAPAGTKQWVLAGEVEGQSLAFTDTAAALACGRNYNYAVIAFNAGGTSPFSAIAASGTRPCAPAAVSVKALSAEVVLVMWNDNSANETSFTVQDSTGITFSRFDTVHSYQVGPGSTEFRVPLAQCGRQLYYRVLAANAQGSSSPSTVVPLTVVCLPAAPTDIAVAPAGVGLTTVALQWRHTGENADGYMLAISTDGDFDWHDVAKVPARQTAYTVTGLRPNIVRYFRVRAFNSSGASQPSATLRVQTKRAKQTYLPMLMRQK